MATAAPIPPGGIVSVPDPITGGAGAPLLTSQIVNGTWQNGQTRTIDALARIDLARAEAAPTPLVDMPTLDQSYVPPLPPAITPADPGEAQVIYDNANAQISQLIEDAFFNFQSTYFPDIQPAADAALAWLERALTTGGLGINVDVENAAWERDRARFLAEGGRAEAEAMATWAGRGFPLPPGALTSQLMQIRTATNNQLAAQSRDISIKRLDVEVENARFASQQALNLRIAALSAAGDYVKTLILGPQTAMQLATGLAGLRTEFARSLTALYSAQVAALEPRIRLQIADFEGKLRAQETNVRSYLTIIEQRVKAATDAAQMLATQAAALLNGINAGVSISGSDSSSL